MQQYDSVQDMVAEEGEGVRAEEAFKFEKYLNESRDQLGVLYIIRGKLKSPCSWFKN